MQVHCDNGLTGQCRNLHIMAGLFSINNLCLAGKSSLMVGDMLVNLGILPETSKSIACWDMDRS